MAKKVTWKKGMRLSTEVFNAADAACDEAMRLISILASSGRYGLFSSSKAFELSVNVSNNALEVVSLCCNGITKGGSIVAIDYDSNYSNTFNTRISIPANSDADGFYLVVRTHDNEWREIDEMYSESKYTFELIGENSIVDKDSLLIGHLVNQYGWRLDETDFVPPCLYVSSHFRYVEQAERIKSLFKNIIDKCADAEQCVARVLLSSIWTAASNALIRIDKERDTLTPGQLFSEVQQVISSFVIGCKLDAYINLENKEPFVNYAQKPYDAKRIYEDVEHGLSLCAEISTKVDAVKQLVAQPEPKIVQPIKEDSRKEKPQPPTEEERRRRRIIEI